MKIDFGGQLLELYPVFGFGAKIILQKTVTSSKLF